MGSPLLYRLFVPQGLLRFVLVMLGLSLGLLANGLGIVWVAAKTGAYAAVALVAAFTLLSLLIFGSSVSRYLKRVRTKARQGVVPEMAYIHLGALLSAVLLVVIPGPFTFVMAWLVYLPPTRLLVGMAVYRSFRAEFTALHEQIQSE